MGLLQRVFGLEPQAGTPGPSEDFWYEPTFGLSNSGQVVTADTAMRLGAVYAAVRVISETVAQVPIIIYRRLPNGGKERADHPLTRLLGHKPNVAQDSFQFREMATGHVALRGNGYAEKIRGRGGVVDQLVPLNPARMRPERLLDGRRRFRYTTELGAPRVFAQEDVFFLPGLSFDGISGVSPIGLQRETLGVAAAARDYGARFFRNDARPGGVLEHAGHFKTDEDREEFRASWQRSQTGPNRHRMAVLEDGMTYKEIGLSNEDAQFLETRKYSDVEIARIFNLPPHKLQILDQASFSNIEQQAIDFVVGSMVPWFVRWECAINTQLIARPDVFFAEFLLDGLLRGDTAARYSAYGSGITNGWLTRNEARSRENLNPLPGLDEPLSPLNMRQGANAPQPERRQGARQAIKVMADDAAGRLVSREIRELDQALARAGTGDDLRSRVARIYDGQAEFMRKTLLPINIAVRTAFAGSLDVESLTGAWCAAQVAALTAADLQPGAVGCGDAAALLAEWRETKAAALAARIMEGIDNG